MMERKLNKYILILIVLYSVLLLVVNLLAVAWMFHKSYEEIQVIYRNLWIITLVLLFLLLATALIVSDRIRGEIGQEADLRSPSHSTPEKIRR